MFTKSEGRTSYVIDDGEEDAPEGATWTRIGGSDLYGHDVEDDIGE